MMKNRSRAPMWALCAFAAVWLACDGGDVEQALPGGTDDDAVEVATGGDIVQAAARAGGRGAPAEAAPRRLYYDLTVFEWYRQGEPLRVDEQPYLPDGKPRAIPAERMRRIDTYRGVDVYALEGSRPPYGAVFVPVFRRYWQPFVLQHRPPVRAD